MNLYVYIFIYVYLYTVVLMYNNHLLYIYCITNHINHHIILPVLLLPLPALRQIPRALQGEAHSVLRTGRTKSR